MIRLFIGLILAMTLAAGHRKADASSVIYYSLDKLAKEAEVILVGRCTSCQANWNENRTIITTEINFQVSSYLKGFLGAQVTVRQLGGTVGQDSMVVSGMPEFQPSGEVILFLSKDQTGGYQVIGMSQGKFEVIEDADTGEKLVRAASISDAELVHTAQTHSESSVSPVPVGHLTLKDFCAQVQTYIEEAQK